MELLEQFRGIDKIPVFEINLRDFDDALEDDEFELHWINADELGLYTNEHRIMWDNTFSLDEHLQELYERIIESYCIYSK